MGGGMAPLLRLATRVTIRTPSRVLVLKFHNQPACHYKPQRESRAFYARDRECCLVAAVVDKPLK